MATYYVATNGNNGNPGTLPEPWATFKYAESQLSEGDTVYVRGGTYHQRLTVDVANVSFLAYQDESVVIDGEWTLPVNDLGIWVHPMSPELIKDTHQHMVALLAPGVTFDGFEIKNVSGVGLKVHGYYRGVYDVTVKNCSIHDIYQYGLQISHDASNILIEDCEIYKGAYCVEALCGGSGGLCRQEGYPGDPATITTPHANGVTFRRCIIRDSYNEGINLEHGSNNITVEYCEIYGNRKMQLYVVSSTNHIIRYNLIYGTENNKTGTLGGAGVEINHESQWVPDEGNPIITNHKIYGNLIANLKNGIIIGGDINRSSQNFSVYNNTIIHNKNYGISISSGVGQNSVFKNNIIWNPLGQISNVPSGIIFDYNLWSRTPDVDSQGSNDPAYALPKLSKTSGWDNLTGGELNGSEFVLQSGSPAINKGANLGAPYNQGLNPASTWPDNVSTLDQNGQGSGWEIGAFVYIEGATPAEGRIVNLDYPASVGHGAVCDINAAIKNIGELSGLFKMQIFINSALKATSPAFTLAGGKTSVDKIAPFNAPTTGESMAIMIKCIRSV